MVLTIFSKQKHLPETKKLPLVGPKTQELKGCALIRELHVYGTLVAARRDASTKGDNDERPQHIGAMVFNKGIASEKPTLVYE